MAAHLDPNAQPLVDASDMELVEFTRAGNSAAFGELWVRHSNAGRAVARSHRFDADDLLSEAFARVFQAISAGGGPTAAFRPYLFTTIRNVSMQWARAKSADASEDLDLMADPSTEEDASLAALDKSLTVNAFRSLPTRWQEALWYSEVEQLSSQEIAPLLGMKANAVSALTYRAREGLRQAWIQAHLQRTTDPECATTIERLGSFTRGMLGTRESKRVRDHLATCTSCSIVADEARHVGSRLALVLLPLAAGVSGAAGFLAWLQAGGGAAGGMVVASAMPSSVGSGAANVVAPTSAAPSSGTALAGTSNSSAGGAAGAGGSVVAGGAGLGAAGIVGGIVGALALAATVVAAVTLGPGLWNAPAATTADSSATSSEDTSDSAPSDVTIAAPPVVEPQPTSAPAPTAEPTPPAEQPQTPSTPTTPAEPTAPEKPLVPEIPSLPAAPSTPPVQPPVPPVEPTTPPVEPPVEPPVDPEPPIVTPPVVTYLPDQDPDRLTFPVYSGFAALPEAIIEVIDVDDNVLATTSSDANGSWTISSFPGVTSGGERQIRIQQYLPSTPENKSTPTAQQPLAVAASPSVTFAPNAGANPGETLATINGAPNGRVEIFVDGAYFGVAPLDPFGTWSYSFAPTGSPISVTLQYSRLGSEQKGLLSDPYVYVQ